MINGAVLEQKKLKKTGFYKKRILEIQENFKLFTVIIGVISLIMLILNIVNACKGSIGLGWIIFLNIFWAACAGGFVLYVLLSAKRKQDYFRKIDEINYGETDGAYELCLVDKVAEPLEKGSVVRLYETEKNFCLITDGIREKLNSFWTKYNFKQDFGALYLSKEAFRSSEENGLIILEGEGEKIYLRRKEK